MQYSQKISVGLHLCDEFLGLFLALVVFSLADAAASQQVVAKVGGGVAVFFGDVAALDKGLVQGGQDDLHVAKEGDVLDVFQVVVDLCFPGDGVAAANLCESAEALAHGVALALFRGHEYHVTDKLRSRPNYCHVALEDVKEFRQLVQAGAAEELAVLGQANVVGKQVALGVAGVGHGAELYQLEDTFILARAGLCKEGIAAHLDGTQNRKHKKNRAQAENCHKRANEINDSFKKVLVHSS